ncbi:MAG TPA: MerR family transcriptional regulator [Solirubrobacterales bacterium]|jgi:MerR family transcriptional regulator/heat shock protein HspR|nr:MerR family transcriptional regulator [Solirubrobacterales bacterium]
MAERDRQGLYMISVAATLAGMHPQTLRIYEQRRLITPHRTPKGTRLYSDENVQTLRRIQELTEEGMNLAGVERVFDLEAQIARMQRRVTSLERQLEQTRREALAEVERIRRHYRAELVPYRPQVTALTLLRDRANGVRSSGESTRIEVKRPGPEGDEK